MVRSPGILMMPLSGAPAPGIDNGLGAVAVALPNEHSIDAEHVGAEKLADPAAADPASVAGPPVIRNCRDNETNELLAVINAAAQAYRGVIPDDRWHDPYMPASELHSELASGVTFVACEIGGAVAGVMGIQRVRNVDPIRDA